MRGRNCSIIGCTVLQPIGRGIMLFGPVSSGASIVGNMVANVKSIGSTSGTGIYFAGPETLGEPAPECSSWVSAKQSSLLTTR